MRVVKDIGVMVLASAVLWVLLLLSMLFMYSLIKALVWIT